MARPRKNPGESKPLRPHEYKKHFISAVVKRSGICRATVEIVLRATFDETRFQLAEGSQCVPIESFGTFAVVDMPERQYRCIKDGQPVVRTIPPKRRLKFAPTKNLRREIEQQQYDPSRRSFVHHVDDPFLRTRKALKYKGSKQGLVLEAVKPTQE